MTNLQQEHAALEEEFAAFKEKTMNEIAALKTRNAELEKLVARKPEDVEQTRFHIGTGIKFKRGPETGGRWMPFCPRCPSPLGGETYGTGDPFAYCIAQCGVCTFDLPTDFQSFIDDFNKCNA